MLEFKKLCDEYEKLSAIERGIILTESSVSVMASLKSIPFANIDPISVLAGFIIGSAACDGKINEKEYLMIYPALVMVFGESYDFTTVKRSFSGDREGRATIAKYAEYMIYILNKLDDELKYDILTLCLCATSVDSKISLREKRYLKRLCRVFSEDDE